MIDSRTTVSFAVHDAKGQLLRAGTARRNDLNRLRDLTEAQCVKKGVPFTAPTRVTVADLSATPCLSVL